jgi:hypothetical protein
MRRTLLALAALALAACSFNQNDIPCKANDNCAPGWVCNTAKGLCVQGTAGDGARPDRPLADLGAGRETVPASDAPKDAPPDAPNDGSRSIDAGAEARLDMTIVDAPPPDVTPWQISLFAGALGGLGTAEGTGTDARFHSPWALAYDSASGTLYVADPQVPGLWKVVVATGVTSTVPGIAIVSGGIALDGAGDIFLADVGGNVIKKRNLTTGADTILAGSGATGSADGTGSAATFNQPTGLAYDGTNLYVSDTGNATIRTIVAGTGVVTTLAGLAGSTGDVDMCGSSARFQNPQGLTLGAIHLFVSDSPGLREILPANGCVSTVLTGIGGPGALAWDGSSNVYVASNPLVWQYGNLTRVDLNAMAATTISGVPAGGVVNGGLPGLPTTLYLGVPGAVESFDTSTQAVTPIAGRPPQSGTTDGPGSVARFLSPLALATDGAGTIYVADYTTVRRISPTALVTTLTSPADGGVPMTALDPLNPSGLALSADNTTLYVANSGRNVVLAVDVSSMSSRILAGSATGQVGASDGVGGAASFNEPYGLAVQGNTLYVADTGNETLRAIDIPSQTVTTVAGKAGVSGTTPGMGTNALLAEPQGLTLDGAGNLYIGEYSCDVRQVMLPSMSVSTLAGNGANCGLPPLDGIGASANFGQIQGITYANGFLYTTESVDGGLIRRINVATQAVITFAGTRGRNGVLLGPLPGSLNRPWGILATGGLLYVTDDNENSILTIGP